MMGLGFITENLGWKLFSLLVALLLWFAVASEPELSTFASVPVEFKNLPDELEISSDVVTAVHLELRGPSGELRNFVENKTAVVVDMSGVGPGQRTFFIGSGDVKLPRGIRLIRTIPSELHFDFEPRRTRPVPVTVRLGAPPAGYEVVTLESIPPSLTVVGPESHVNRIRSVVTDPVDISSVAGTAEFRVNTYVEDPHVRFQSPPEVTVKVTMRKR